MAELDWTELDDVLSSGSLARGVSAGFTPPPGGGSFVYGWNSLDASDGSHGLYVNLVDFAPMALGGSIRACIKRAPSGGPLGFSAFLFMGLQGTSVNDEGYLLGLNNANPCRIELRKGSIAFGLPDVAPGGSGVLRRGSSSVALDEWVHLRLDMISEELGDVRLQVFQNDLDANPLGGAPVWDAIPGMAEFVDDALGVASGSVPFVSGYGGFAFQTSEVTRRAQVDHLDLRRQT
jgi:hypothetical protein